jgi:hypothetical protein
MGPGRYVLMKRVVGSTHFGPPMVDTGGQGYIFGVKPAAEEYQRRRHDALQGLPGIIIVADDILVYRGGATMEEAVQDHDHNLTQLLQRVR